MVFVVSANDYVGKGLSGGRIIIRHPPTVDYKPQENVIIGKPIPAGTGLSRYRKLGLTYKGVPVVKTAGDALPDYAPEELRETEELLPQPQDWSLDGEGYLVDAVKWNNMEPQLSMATRARMA